MISDVAGIERSSGVRAGSMHRRLRVEEAHALDLARLRRAGVFETNESPVWSSRHPNRWTGAIESEITYLVIPGALHPRSLLLLGQDPAEPGKGTYVAPLEWSPCHLGGYRPWFRCQLAVQGEPCDRRVRILYRPPGAPYFGCRHCHQLSYRTRQLSGGLWYEGFDRPMAAAAALRRTLDRRCGDRRRHRAWFRCQKAEPGMQRLLAKVGQ